MKTTLLGMCLLLASLNGYAGELSQALNCKSDSGTLSIQGSLDRDGFLTATVTVAYGQSSFAVENIKYAPNETPGSYELIKDEAAALAKDEGLYFVPSSFYIPVKGTPEKFRRYFYLWIPTLDENGEKNPILIRGTLACE